MPISTIVAPEHQSQPAALTPDLENMLSESVLQSMYRSRAFSSVNQWAQCSGGQAVDTGRRVPGNVEAPLLSCQQCVRHDRQLQTVSSPVHVRLQQPGYTVIMPHPEQPQSSQAAKHLPSQLTSPTLSPFSSWLFPSAALHRSTTKDSLGPWTLGNLLSLGALLFECSYRNTTLKHNCSFIAQPF